MKAFTLEALEPTNLRISTMVATANTSTPIHLMSLFEQIHTKLIPLGYPGEGILKMEHQMKVVGIASRDAFTNRKVSNKTFFNQSTVILRRLVPGSTNVFKEVNIKMFANGGVQMTGIPSIEFAKGALQELIDQIGSLPKNPFVNPADAAISKFNVQLVNSDYTIKYPIKRDELHTLLTREYGLFSTNESTIYQGVNTKYYYNKAYTNLSPPGVCHCSGDTVCTGQGNGEGEGQCKRVTLSVFQTGKIIITGARDMDQIMEVYHYFNKVLVKHAHEILRIPPATAVAT
jgi:TATA-box binding protein (TBP) (component of TFIID and TFIIIB)